MLRIACGVTLSILALAAGCDNGNTNPTPTSDLAAPSPDLAAPTPDLATPSDLAPPTVVPPVGCNTTTVVSGTTAYNTISAGNRCMGAGCHNQMQDPVFSNRATFTAVMINKPSSSAYQYVVPNMPDQSYLLYKLRGTHLSVPKGNGGQMPTGGTFLNDTEFCTVYNWVSHGAPVN